MEFRLRENLLKTRIPAQCALRDRAIGEYHDMLVADEELSAEVFAKLHDAMRESRLVYGQRPIGISLRPHLLDEKQFRALTQNTELLANGREKIAAGSPIHRSSNVTSGGGETGFFVITDKAQASFPSAQPNSQSAITRTQSDP